MYDASAEDFLRLAGVGGGASLGGGGAKDKVFVARMQGLPYRATEMEIVSVLFESVFVCKTFVLEI